MKPFKSLTISIAALIAASSICVGAAFAAEEPTTAVYPDSFKTSLSFEGGLTDYAVYGDTYAFAYNGLLAVLKGNGNNERLPEIKPVSSITQLDYSKDGELYVCFADGYCVYPNLTEKKPLSEIEVQSQTQYMLTVEGATYALNNDNGSILYMTAGGFESVTVKDSDATDVAFGKLKKYDDTAYAVANNTLYKMEGAVAVAVDPDYYGYIEKTKAIPTGSAAQLIKSGTDIKKGEIKKGKYYTEISIENGIGATFEVVNPATATKLTEDKLYCLVLAETGTGDVPPEEDKSPCIITMGGKCYITARSSVSSEVDPHALSDVESKAAYAVEKTGVYSRPYISKATKLCDLESGSDNAVTVLGQYTDLTGKEFYKVEYTDNGNKVTGYCAKGLMTSYAFPAEDEELHTDGGDKEFEYDTNVVTVVLAVAIVALVIIAILYVAAVTARRKMKEKKKAAKQKPVYDDDDEDE